jgi:hypothetical protein
MAKDNSDKTGRGLFGLGARQPAAAPGTATVRRDAATAAMATVDIPGVALETRNLNLRALAGAAIHGVALPAEPALEIAGLPSRAPHFADVRSAWFSYWVQQLHCTVRPHRKLWEFSVVLQAMYEAGVLAADCKVLGFGVGDEPIPSYLAALGLSVVATDLPDAAERDYVLNPAFVNADAFDQRVEVSNLDMRRVDDVTLRGFDACWSCGVLNEMTTVEEALETAIGAMDVLRPGGIAIHTTEFAFADDVLPPVSGALVFTRSFFERLQEGLNGRGHQVVPISFDLGAHPLDGYVDLGPFEIEASEAWTDVWREDAGAPHLKLIQAGVRQTSFAFMVRARG